MGTWGSAPFENDGAGDLLADIRHGEFTFEDVDAAFADDEYLEADGGQLALALVELALAVHGQPHSPLPDGDEDAVVAAFAPHLTPGRTVWLCEQAERALADPDTSELYELWTEPGADAWREAALASVARLRAVARG
ncbi:DUF4259 domain-containing protein [Cellulomonas endometrii]|jgi:hypothetical protein|uniref:DUF4259 domain-containing protein n=1 Tax=Cellulomonas endometrii TaxID=3036301 RepID=UPI0024ADE13F|nr:DUF4259 domain-containing protein [Cellulomonas endometrii]